MSNSTADAVSSDTNLVQYSSLQKCTTKYPGSDIYDYCELLNIIINYPISQNYHLRLVI